MEINSNLGKVINQNNLVIFVGSGLSIRFGLPNWKKMVSDIINQSDKTNYKAYLPLLEMGEEGMTPIEVLEKLKAEHSIIRSYIKKEFQILKGDFSLHKKIFELTGQIITTNYDNAFESALNNTIIPTVYTSKFNISEINKTTDPYILKLHGTYSEPDHCIVFSSDYEKLYGHNNATVEKLKSLFIGKTILFIGFSFNDPDINSIFDNLNTLFDNYNKHYILTETPDLFNKFNFLEPINVLNSEIEEFIDHCLDYKLNKNIEPKIIIEDSEIKIERENKIAFLSPKPIDINLHEEFDNVLSCFDSLNATIYNGCLNFKTLLSIEDFDLVVIVTKVFKGKLFYEEENIKSNLIEVEELLKYIPNENLPVVFITNEILPKINSFNAINISSYKKQIISKFIYKALKNNDYDFVEKEIISGSNINFSQFTKGVSNYTSIYGNNRILEIGKRSLSNVVGRIEEQSALSLKVKSIINSDRLLNIKASGGTGKTTLIKKIAYELYNRGYFTQGVSFKSCESIKSLSDIEELIVEGFGLYNILNFKEYIIDNFSNSKFDKLIILDNFETVVNNLSKDELIKVVDLLKFCCGFINIVITSRERLTQDLDFEDIFTLTPLITDDAFYLFTRHYGEVKSTEQIRILREEILENLLNNNPLAILLVTNSRTKYIRIEELRDQLNEHFFESTNDEYSSVFKNDADLNIEKSKSIYQSINYSYKTLNSREKIAFELLSLFPDGISLSNFKKCFEKKKSTNSISDKELRILKDKSLLEDYNGTLQLQPIIRRFAEYQFNKRPKETKKKYCLDAYNFNHYVLQVTEFVRIRKTFSEALKIYVYYKNNLLNVLSFMVNIEDDSINQLDEKKHLLHFIFDVQRYFINEKQIFEFSHKLKSLSSYFKIIPNSDMMINTLLESIKYYHKEFNNSYEKLTNILSVEQMLNRKFDEEPFLENMYKDMISSIHSMEGYTLQYLKTFITNNNFDTYLLNDLFYLGIKENTSSLRLSFYYFEYQSMYNKLDIKLLEKYIANLYIEEHLNIMQCTYTLSKNKLIEKESIKKLVVTNPYTKGLKEAMLAFSETNLEKKTKYFKAALQNLQHIKYYFLEVSFFYCKHLKEISSTEYSNKLKECLIKCEQFKYQYLNHMFKNLEGNSNNIYNFSYEYYDYDAIQNFVEKHDKEWIKALKEKEYV